MAPWKKLLSFNRQERNGIFYLLLFIILLQIGYYFVVHLRLGGSEAVFHIDPATVTRLRVKADSVMQRPGLKVFPFNPNFISDYKGYILGLSVAELDSLNEYRASGNYVESAAEFQKVTGISDTLLSALTPFFRFGRHSSTSEEKSDYQESSPRKTRKPKFTSGVVMELNNASAKQLRAVPGIGPVLSERIIRFREALGGFLTEGQLLDVYGLDEQVALRAMARFKVMDPPVVEKVNINTANVEELARNTYISYYLARSIVRFREKSGAFTSLDELSALEGFPSEKIDRISLYLTL
jgi:competence ComEA-like helix-hairpin-helix protein